jgi:hypothetical protein
MVVTAPGWAIRPQVVSLLLLVLMAHLAVRDQLWWLPGVCVVWANVHALVIFGLVIAGALVAEATLWSRDRVPRTLAVAACCAAAPLLTPASLSYWPQVLRTVSLSRELQIEEYRSAFAWEDLAFWVGLVLLVALVALRGRRLQEHPRGDRVLVIAALVLGAAAVTAARNEAVFGVVAAPALTRLWPLAPRRGKERYAGALGYGLVGMALVAGALVAAFHWRSADRRAEWAPIDQATLDAVEQCQGPLLNRFEDGGYLMWRLPQKRVFVDSRLEAYPEDVLHLSRRADLFGEYEVIFQRYGVNCVIVTTGSPLHRRLEGVTGFMVRHRDANRVVLERMRGAS